MPTKREYESSQDHRKKPVTKGQALGEEMIRRAGFRTATRALAFARLWAQFDKQADDDMPRTMIGYSSFYRMSSTLAYKQRAALETALPGWSVEDLIHFVDQHSKTPIEWESEVGVYELGSFRLTS
jgi:hypothetical protein